MILPTLTNEEVRDVFPEGVMTHRAYRQQPTAPWHLRPVEIGKATERWLRILEELMRRAKEPEVDGGPGIANPRD